MKIDLENLKTFRIFQKREHHFVIDDAMIIGDEVLVNYQVKDKGIGFKKSYKLDDEKGKQKLMDLIRIVKPDIANLKKEFIPLVLMDKEFLADIDYFDDYVYFKNARAICTT